MDEILTKLSQVIQQRQHADPDGSYVARLVQQGPDAVLQKIGEEATETILAAKSENREQVVYETADLWFHTLIMLAQHGLGPQDVCDELTRRFGLSGVKEKREREK